MYQFSPFSSVSVVTNLLTNINTIDVACERKYLSSYKFEIPVAIENQFKANMTFCTTIHT